MHFQICYGVVKLEINILEEKIGGTQLVCVSIRLVVHLKIHFQNQIDIFKFL